MGVPGLWDILYELGRSRSLINLAIQEGFEGNRSGRRAYRIGVDASLWYAHAAFAKGGENPDLRLLFFRCLQLAKLAIVPYFVFDGRLRPPIKRGSKMGKAGSHTLTPGFKKILECFGWTWREAPGEAEAELAYLTREGIIDAVLTDDGDALIFGATMVIRNQSTNLTGNKSKPALDTKGKASKDHVMIFTSSALAQDGLNRAGLILIALLCGGDYVKEGVKGFGKATATGLARAGFGQRLLDIYALRDDPDYVALMAQWRSAVHDELRTNSKGFLKHKHASLVLPASFPDLKVFGYYADPVTSRGRPAPQIRDTEDICLPRLAAFCEKHFGEWGYEETIIKRFRTLVWESAMSQMLRRAALQVDEMEREQRVRLGNNNRDIRTVLRPAAADAHGLTESFVTRLMGLRVETGISDAFVNRPARTVTSQTAESKNVLQMKIVGSTRKHTSTDGLLEYRVEFTPTLLVELTRLGISGTRGDPPPPASRTEVDPWDVDFGPQSSQPKAKGPSKPAPPPESPLRVWVCASMLEQVFPDLLEDASATRAGKRKTKVGRRVHRDNDTHFSDYSSGDETLRAQSSPAPQHATPRAPQPLRHTASQPVPGSSGLHAPRAASPLRSPLRPTQPRARPVTSLPLPLKKKTSGFLFAFPYTDDPNMLLLEEGLDIPLGSSAAIRQPRSQIPSTTTSSPAPSSSQTLRRSPPPRTNPPPRRPAQQLSRPATASGSSRTRTADDSGFDVASMFGGGDSDDADEQEPDIIRNASSVTNNRMDHIFDAVFKPRGKGKGRATAKRAAPAPSASQPRPTKKRRTTQPLPQTFPSLPPPSPPHPRRASPAPAPMTSRVTGLTRHSSDAGRSRASRASSEVIEIDSDSDDGIRTVVPVRHSSQSTRFVSDDDSIIDLS